ncbi:eukaryotic translation initiation factor 5B-like [Leptopilina heterotoma]|uniref:eukaryotic translation initiation factor 5B-like n=1 Tax=Leptopilina heterotoma TaxID=63436 RepID=UPI001CA93FE7|nr:eukaryotic translation initiation factor 5B-like [Leptopilina heterotoma]
MSKRKADCLEPDEEVFKRRKNEMDATRQRSYRQKKSAIKKNKRTKDAERQRLYRLKIKNNQLLIKQQSEISNTNCETQELLQDENHSIQSTSQCEKNPKQSDCLNIDDFISANKFSGINLTQGKVEPTKKEEEFKEQKRKKDAARQRAYREKIKRKQSVTKKLLEDTETKLQTTELLANEETQIQSTSHCEINKFSAINLTQDKAGPSKEEDEFKEQKRKKDAARQRAYREKIKRKQSVTKKLLEDTETKLQTTELLANEETQIQSTSHCEINKFSAINLTQDKAGPSKEEDEFEEQKRKKDAARQRAYREKIKRKQSVTKKSLEGGETTLQITKLLSNEEIAIQSTSRCEINNFSNFNLPKRRLKRLKEEEGEFKEKKRKKDAARQRSYRDKTKRKLSSTKKLLDGAETTLETKELLSNKETTILSTSCSKSNIKNTDVSIESNVMADNLNISDVMSENKPFNTDSDQRDKQRSKEAEEEYKKLKRKKDTVRQRAYRERMKNCQCPKKSVNFSETIETFTVDVDTSENINVPIVQNLENEVLNISNSEIDTSENINVSIVQNSESEVLNISNSTYENQCTRNNINQCINDYVDVKEHYIGPLNILCQHCEAKHFPAEKVFNKKNSFSNCCSHGEVVLDPLPDPPTILKELFDGTHKESKHFHDRIRSYNNSFAFASFNANLVNFNNRRPGPFCFKIHGQIYYQINTSLYPSDNDNPFFGQLFIVDQNEATQLRCDQSNLLNPDIVNSIDQALRDYNIFAKSYQMIHEEFQATLSESNSQSSSELQLLFSLKPGTRPNARSSARVYFFYLILI